MLADARQKLREAFEGLSISVSALHRHLVERARQTFVEKLEILPLARITDRFIKLRKERVEKREETSDLISLRAAFSLMKQGLICIFKETMALILGKPSPKGMAPK